MNRPFLIGLTGGIASGKNAVAEMLSRRGAAVVDADRVSRDLVAPGSPLLAKIVEAWGEGVLSPDGSLDRKALSSRVFGDTEAVGRLNALTHPAILAEMARRAEASGESVAVFMAPLLFEAGGEGLVDEVWVVTADEGERVRRILARDGLSETEARARIAVQVSPAQARARADVVIENDGDLVETERQVDEAWQAVVARLPIRGA
ncbi:MAG: dephospho-CoA kinase [Proteobacteria bacterium]|nr:dephospho-CoA kinase [Pseudomonadota bacterium]